MTRQQLGLTMGQKPAIVLWITVDEQEHTYNKLEISHTSVVPLHSCWACLAVSAVASSRTGALRTQRRRAPRDNAFPLLN